MAHHNLTAHINAQTISFSLYEISNSEGLFVENSRPSDFIEASLKTFGDSIRPNDCPYFWLGGKYLWFVDAEQSKAAGVWVTDNGILMFQHGDDLYRVVFE